MQNEPAKLSFLVLLVFKIKPAKNPSGIGVEMIAPVQHYNCLYFHYSLVPAII